MQFGKGLKTKGGVGGKTYQYRKIYNICIYKIYTGKDQSQLQQVSIKVENSVKN